MEAVSIGIQHYALQTAIAQLTHNASSFDFSLEELYSAIRQQASETVLVGFRRTGKYTCPRLCTAMKFAGRVVENGDEHTWREKRIESAVAEIRLFIEGRATLEYVIFADQTDETDRTEKTDQMDKSYQGEHDSSLPHQDSSKQELGVEYKDMDEDLSVELENIVLDIERQNHRYAVS